MVVFVVLGMKLFVFLTFSSAVAVSEMECFIAHGKKDGFVKNTGTHSVTPHMVHSSAPNFFNEVTSKEYTVDLKTLWYNLRFTGNTNTASSPEYEAVIDVYHTQNTAPRKYHIRAVSSGEPGHLEFEDVFKDCT